MPRIDPQQLLSCLTPLLAVNGGIKSSGEVIRLANLMEKYSKKLVSKCIYIQILKCTETDLLGQFMAAGGWNLVHTWLNDGVNSSNWPFVQEILEMLLLCPVDGNRLKSNHTPKIVKNLSLNLSQNAIITALSKKLVEQWLKIAHQEKQLLQQQQNGLNGTVNNFNNVHEDNKKSLNSNESSIIKSDSESSVTATENNDTSNINTVKTDAVDGSPKKPNENVKYKISNKESGLVLSIKRSTSPNLENGTEKDSKSPEHKSKSDKGSSSSSSVKSTSSEKDRSKKSGSSSSHKSSSSSKSSHRDKDRSSSSHKSSSSSRDKDKHKSSSSSKHSSSSSRDKEKERDRRKREKEKEQAEKDKETLNFLAPHPSTKLQRIPKRQHSENSENKSESEPSAKSAKVNEVIEKKKPSISIEVRKGDKPKTVKTLKSQFRNHGLAEEPPPPPSRKAIKKPVTTPVILPLATSNTTIPTVNHTAKPISPPPSKKLHLDKALEPDVPERAGGIKLIKPKPMLIESTGFLDALDASAMLNKKDTKKRKRLPSGSSSSSTSTKKDEPESPKIDVKPLKFYKDTLEEQSEEEKPSNGTSASSPTKDIEASSSDEKSVKEEPKSEESSEKVKSDEEVEDEEKEKRPPGIGTGPDGPPGIISTPNFPKRKRAKRSIRWRAQEELEEVRYFELDENERVNVTKTFMEQKQDEHNRERMMMRTKVVELTEWHKPKLVDNVPDIPYGSKSLEAAVQAERERNTLQEMFFNNRSMYDSPHEPDPEQYENVEPAVIPLEDATGNPDSVNNFRDVQWPAPKGDQPQFISQGGFGSLFGNLTANLTIPPAPTLNPLVGFNLGGLQSAIPQDPSALNFMGLIQHQTLPNTPFINQPPPLMQNNYQSNNNNYPNRGSNSSGGGGNSFNSNFGNNRYDSNNRNRSGSSNGSWVRGNTNMRRGMCHQYQRTGHCSKSNCPYIHER